MANTVRFEDVTCTKETAKAILVTIEDETHWIPKSVIHDDSEVFDSDENSRGTLVLPEWFAEKEQLG